MLQTDKGTENKIEVQQKCYRDYAFAAEKYVRMPTLDNWEKKEKAFETYNALIRFRREIA
ncbi:MAG: hypothetical protein HYX61_01000 [Gammaproteobacteria bacterium]|jgi:hypothetical protein|nr:hypothetical protein [Gammaproteobacteria bacterium]